MYIFADGIQYVGENKKGIKVKNLIVDGYNFGTKTMDINGNMFARMVLNYAQNFNIPIDDPEPIYDIRDFSTQYEMTREMLESQINDVINDVVKQRGYDNVGTCASYITSSIPRYKKDAEIYIAWRDKAWQTVYSILDELENAHSKELPTLQELCDKIGPIDWEIKDN